MEDIEVQPNEPVQDGVFVAKRVAPDGSINTEVIVSGEVVVTEVQTILELGVQGWRKRIGLVH